MSEGKRKPGRPKYVYLDKFDRVKENLEARIESLEDDNEALETKIAQLSSAEDRSLPGIISVVAILCAIVSLIVNFSS